MKIKCIVVEDEPLAREGLKAYIHELEFLELAGIAENALQANQLLAELKPDLMFLDIQMPKITGLDFLKSLSHPPLVILTTAYPHYALQGFELDVVDYLVKPYPFDRFLKAVNKVRDLIHLRKSPVADTKPIDHIFIKVDQVLRRINLDDILFVEGMENYLAIHTQQERFITLMTMKSLEEVLPEKKFLRVHKTYIISKSKVLGIVGNEIDLGKTKVPISRSRRNEIIEALVNQH